MRILNIAQTYFPYLAEGGRPFKVLTISRKLAERGHDVTVLTADLGHSEWSAFTAPPQKVDGTWRIKYENVDTIYLPTLFRYRALTLNPRVIRFSGASLAAFDLIHVYGLYDLLGPAVAYFCRRQRKPYVVEPMGMYRPIDRNIRLKHLWRRSMGESFWNHASRIVATSELEQQELIEDGVPAAKIVVRYNGIEPSEYKSLPPRGCFRAKWGISPDEPLILFLSRLIPRKGAEVLIAAFAQACPGDGKLVIAGPEGEPGYRSRLEHCARASGAGARIIFTGPLYDEEKKSAFSDADIFALPSQYENFANAAAEAAACGVPVIISPACGIRSLVEGQAGLVVAPDAGTLADALRKLIRDRNLYARLKEGCRRVASQLSWDHLAKEMEHAYAALLASSDGHA